MSHSKEREEKICLNCKAELNGRFCHLCGQENLEPRETVWTLVSHFFYDITHFDGKFFATLGHLVRKPGFLSKEYMRGRRASYLNPIRMYVFSSALFFIIFFSMFNVRNWNIDNDKKSRKKDSFSGRQKEVAQVIKNATSHLDSVSLADKNVKSDDVDTKSEQKDSANEIKVDSPYRYGGPKSRPVSNNDSTSIAQNSRNNTKKESVKNSTTVVDTLRVQPNGSPGENNPTSMNNEEETPEGKDNDWTFRYTDSEYETTAEYDSTQKKLAPGERDGWLSRRINYRFIELNNKYNGDGSRFLRDLLDQFIHTFPYLLFVSLPLYALFLKLLYIRRRKQFLYVDHGIFLVHLYIFTFIVLLLFFAFYKINEITQWGWANVVQMILMIYGILYTVKAMRNFYGQGWGKTILKFILLNLLAFVTLIFLFGLFFVLTVFRI